MAEHLGQTITVVNKSGKIVSSGKHIRNIWNEAISAYKERKAEIRASKQDPEGARNRIKDKYLDDDESIDRTKYRPVNSRRSSSRHSTQSHRRHRRHEDDTRHEDGRRRREGASRRYSDDRRRYSDDGSSSSGERGSRRHAPKSNGHSKSHRGHPQVQRSYTDNSMTERTSRRRPSRASPSSPSSTIAQEDIRDAQRAELAHRHSDSEFNSRRDSALSAPRRASTQPDLSMTAKGDVDMDLAYGELPPPIPARPGTEEAEIRNKATALNALLEELNCVHHSATTIMKSLEKNPEAMAAVALTLAEISNLARKLAPGALTGLRATAPAVLALLASPEFLIAAGVGVGITVIMFGGYKIIKKIRNDKTKEAPFAATGQAATPGSEQDNQILEELSQADRINKWRRGIDNADGESVGTSVEGELATPEARRRLIEEGVIDPSSSRSKSSKDKSVAEKEKKEKKAKEKEEKKKEQKKDKDDRSSRSTSPSGKSDKEKDKGKEKEPSGLRMLFKRQA